MTTNPTPLVVRDALSCAWHGLRDALSFRLIILSIGLWLGAVLLWALVAFFAWSWLMHVAAWLAGWALLGLFVIFPSLLTENAQARIANVSITQGAEALLGPGFAVASWIMLALLLILAVLITVRIALEVFLMPVVREKVKPHYPPFAPTDEKDHLLAPVVRVAKFGALAVCALPLLLIPVVNVIVGVGFFGYLNVRTLVSDALEGIASPSEQRAVINAARGRLILLGMMMVGAIAIPFLGLIGPAWLGAATCHLCFRTLHRLRGTAATG